MSIDIYFPIGYFVFVISVAAKKTKLWEEELKKLFIHILMIAMEM